MAKQIVFAHPTCFCPISTAFEVGQDRLRTCRGRFPFIRNPYYGGLQAHALGAWKNRPRTATSERRHAY
jgi:hypothetical protein